MIHITLMIIMVMDNHRFATVLRRMIVVMLMVMMVMFVMMIIMLMRMVVMVVMIMRMWMMMFMIMVMFVFITFNSALSRSTAASTTHNDYSISE
ncbi:hypothetical protein PROVALCAL_02227 [Providencia alcalifaciens DSM 30120]|uniref:Uncharacterized protein n=1 Tax=Providencia alcalifaciens DSM 30120 TaxID=520999 RepID=B6XFU1_9GAMM|nr:hypothetical protein PROVALCAL_02227 [Providencia alcalifaciens DSM 30120]